MNVMEDQLLHFLN